MSDTDRGGDVECLRHVTESLLHRRADPGEFRLPAPLLPIRVVRWLSEDRWFISLDVERLSLELMWWYRKAGADEQDGNPRGAGRCLA